MKRAGLTVALFVVALVGLPTPASAASVIAVGWWTRSPAASAPEGGITVSNAPDGPVSVAAVRVDLGTTGVSSATITLAQTGGAAPAGAQLVVCVVGDSWKAEPGAALDAAPATSCTGTSTALVANGETWSANVADLVGEARGTLSFAVVPSAGSGGLWDLQFDKPQFQGTPASTGTGRSTATTAPRSTPTTGFAARPAESSFSTPRPPTVSATTTTVAITPTTVNNFVPNVAPNEVAFGGATDEDGGAQGRPVGQAITLVLLAAVVGVLGGLAHKVVTARATA